MKLVLWLTNDSSKTNSLLFNLKHNKENTCQQMYLNI